MPFLCERAGGLGGGEGICGLELACVLADLDWVVAVDLEEGVGLFGSGGVSGSIWTSVGFDANRVLSTLTVKVAPVSSALAPVGSCLSFLFSFPLASFDVTLRVLLWLDKPLLAVDGLASWSRCFYIRLLTRAKYTGIWGRYRACFASFELVLTSRLFVSILHVHKTTLPRTRHCLREHVCLSFGHHSDCPPSRGLYFLQLLVQ